LRREDARASFFFVRGALPDDDDVKDDDANKSLWKEDPVAAVFKRMYAPNAGKRIAYGIFLKPIDDDSFSAANKLKITEEEKARLRDKARQEMTVIDEEERKRRGERFLDVVRFSIILRLSLCFLRTRTSLVHSIL